MTEPLYTGRCNCGAVTAEFFGKPAATRQCWCKQCQKTAAGGPTNNAMFPTDEVKLNGPLGSWAYQAPSGNMLTHYFCAACGTPVYAQSSARPQFMTFRIGFLDEPHGLAPEIAIWTSEKPAWAAPDPDMVSFPGQPPVLPSR